MLRIVALAALAAAAVAAPASAASIHVSTTGKSPEQVKAEVTKAAAHLCHAENDDSAIAYQLQQICVRATVRNSLAQSADPSLVTVATR
jgi:sirohydrochlorin ferrochelatase